MVAQHTALLLYNGIVCQLCQHTQDHTRQTCKATRKTVTAQKPQAVYLLATAQTALYAELAAAQPAEQNSLVGFAHMLHMSTSCNNQP